MVYHLSFYLKEYVSPFNVVHYVSFRAIAGLLTTVCMSIASGGVFISLLGPLLRSDVRSCTPDTHKAKGSMPTMGGLLILSMVIINTLLWCNLYSYEVWMFLYCMTSFGIIGFWDDYAKILYQRGISAQTKFFFQCLVAVTVALYFFFAGYCDPIIVFPFFKSLQPNIGIFFIAWVIFVLVGTSNAVNLTDGLDGLAINALMPNFATFAIISYLAGHCKLACYLAIPYAHSSELAVIGGILVGASLGFLWFNAYPAQIFMGDVGSLSLGAALGFIALATKQELLLALSGGLFVIETVSVIIQVVSFRFFKKRIFKMAPIHHHFELLGWQESKITVRFGIISLILCLLALVSLKMR